MITFKEQCQVYYERYRLNATEVASNAKLDREILDNKEDRHCLFSIESYNQYLDDMESLGEA